MNRFLKIAVGVVVLYASFSAFVVYKRWPLPYEPQYTVDLPTIGGVPGVIWDVYFPESDRSRVILAQFWGRNPREVVVRQIEDVMNPSEAELAAFERNLAAYMGKHRPSDAINAPSFIRPLLCHYKEDDLIRDALQNSFRQYWMVKSEGRKFLIVTAVDRVYFEQKAAYYGNGLPIDDDESYATNYELRDKAGPTAFRAVFDIAAGKIISLRYSNYEFGLC